MPAASGGNLTTTVAVLSVSPVNEDQVYLERIFSDSKWTLHTSPTFESALTMLPEIRPPVILCGRDLEPGTWKEMLDYIGLLPDPPLLIVTSRLADEFFWAEALNLGAYDVLATPFDRQEVIRAVNSAWLHWRDQNENTLHYGRRGFSAAA
jgi:DNA-binding response OmpR family regulator